MDWFLQCPRGDQGAGDRTKVVKSLKLRNKYSLFFWEGGVEAVTEILC